MRTYHRVPAWCRRTSIVLGCLALLASATHAQQWFLKIDPLPGILTDGRFAGWTPLQMARASVSLPVNPTNGTPGPASFSCEISKAFDRLSPALLQRCGDAEPFRRVTLACVVTQPRPALHRITLDNVLVSSVAHEGSRNAPGTVEKERVRFSFDKIEFACLELGPNGGTSGGLTARFDHMAGVGDLKTRPPFRVTVARQNGLPGVWLTWPAERGHRYQIRTGTANGGVWKTSEFITATEDGTLSHYLPAEALDLLMRVDEVD